MSNATWYILSYDIRSPRRLRRVHQFLRTRAYALQESVFAWQGDTQDLTQLQQELRTLLDLKEDDFRGYPLLAGEHIHWWGTPPLPEGIIDFGYPKLLLHDTQESCQ